MKQRLVASCLVAVLAGLVHSGELWVRVALPQEGQAVAGTVDFEAEVVGVEDVAEVEFLVDGQLVGVVVGEPFQIEVPVNDPTSTHRFTVVARDVSGAEATDSVVTSPVPTHAEYRVELQQLYVTVTGPDGQPVLDLEAADFTVRDDGRPQELVTFARGDIPFTATLLVDASASMYGAKLEAAMEGARVFIRSMEPLDQAKILAFSHCILSESSFTDARDVLTANLSGTQAWGGTSINDHLYIAIKGLEARQGRRVVVLLSDGVDSHSVLGMEEVREQARRGQALLYWLRLRRPGDLLAPDSHNVRLTSAWRTAEEFRRQFQLLEETVRDSGGSILPVESPADIRPSFVEILRELRAQYVLGYYPTTSRDDGRWHPVKVSVSRSGVDVRAHRGYVDL